MLGNNPKDAIGENKPSISKIPPVALLHCAMAMMDGAKKYGNFNWRKNKVLAHIYIDAALRHLLAWADGEEVAPDSKIHHLGHMMACAAILLDAQSGNNLVDDRPIPGKFSEEATKLSNQIRKGKSLPK